jgi:hypothetical protein
MKSGAGDDPFGDLVEEESEATADEATADEATAGEATAGEASDGVSEDPSADTPADATPDEPVDDGDDIPWVLRRRSVKDDRPNVTQFFLRDETDRAERRFRGEVEERLDTDVYLLDLREAAYVVAMRHPDEVASLLGQWGYDYRD